MRDKNSVLFTDTECVVLSSDFKLLDESQVLLRVPRKNNMYTVDLKNVAPSGGLTCLFAKAILDESNLWHRRLGHINFKTMNKLKGKQHKASCKTKTISSISQPLQMLHIDLFGPIIKKMYCLVVTDDYSRFSWVFFLATKYETSGILKAFITGIENLLNHKVKIIRCDNETEFKNKEMNQFCEKQGIKREFSVARTPQQNGVAERKNRTLIEAARTTLADLKLPTTIWAEAVNTACYVQNMVLVIKPHNKTPYEIFHGTKENINAGQAGKKTVPDQEHILLPLWTSEPLLSHGPKMVTEVPEKESEVSSKEDNQDLRDEFERLIQQEKNGENDVNSTNNINTVSSTVNTASIKGNAVDENIVYGCVNDPNMPNLEEIVYSNDNEEKPC
nr:putative ribonuclease H-like domain-containing protein [Tanacetum cinerariifolium]